MGVEGGEEGGKKEKGKEEKREKMKDKEGEQKSLKKRRGERKKGEKTISLCLNSGKAQRLKKSPKI